MPSRPTVGTTVRCQNVLYRTVWTDRTRLDLVCLMIHVNPPRSDDHAHSRAAKNDVMAGSESSELTGPCPQQDSLVINGPGELAAIYRSRGIH